MVSSLAKYHARAPRYILQPQDNTLIRVAGPQQTPWEEGTEIVNISLSGLVFKAPIELSPIVGEFIKIEFSVSPAQKMACHGLVVRLEAQGQSHFLVGVQFYKLEMAHRIALLQGLARKLKDQMQLEQQIESRTHVVETIKSVGHVLLKDKKATIYLIALLFSWLSFIWLSWTYFR